MDLQQLRNRPHVQAWFDLKERLKQYEALSYEEQDEQDLDFNELGKQLVESWKECFWAISLGTRTFQGQLECLEDLNNSYWDDFPDLGPRESLPAMTINVPYEQILLTGIGPIIESDSIRIRDERGWDVTLISYCERYISITAHFAAFEQGVLIPKNERKWY